MTKTTQRCCLKRTQAGWAASFASRWLMALTWHVSSTSRSPKNFLKYNMTFLGLCILHGNPDGRMRLLAFDLGTVAYNQDKPRAAIARDQGRQAHMHRHSLCSPVCDPNRKKLRIPANAPTGTRTDLVAVFRGMLAQSSRPRPPSASRSCCSSA